MALPLVPKLELTEKEKLTVSFRSDEWLGVHLQGGQMVHEAVLDYFAQSVWYEPNCVNELAKAQNMAVSQINAPGRCEFVVGEHAQPPHLFIVRKQARVGAQVKLLACYYVLDGTIFPAPSLHDVISARTMRCVHTLRAAFDTLGKALNPKVEAAKKRQKAEDGSGDPSTSGATSRAPAVDPGAYKSAKRRNMEQFLDHSIWTALASSAEKFLTPAAEGEAAAPEAQPPSMGAPAAAVAAASTDLQATSAQ